MASLYEINSQILDCVDLETGEIVDIERLMTLQMERDNKIESVALWYKNLLSDAEQYKIEKENFAKKEKAAKNKAEQLKKYIADALSGEKFKTTKVAISYRKSEQVEIESTDELTEEYLKYTEPEPDKTKIKQAIKSGIEIPGCQLITNNNIQIK